MSVPYSPCDSQKLFLLFDQVTLATRVRSHLVYGSFSTKYDRLADISRVDRVHRKKWADQMSNKTQTITKHGMSHITLAHQYCDQKE